MIRSESLVRILLTLILTYAVTFGATFNGLLIPELRLFNLGLIALIVLFWLLARWRKVWQWHNTPLDGVFVLWIAAFAISLIANAESWRRSVMGLWFVAFYIGFWYILFDLHANRVLSVQSLVDTFLIAGCAVIFFGFFQFAFIEVDFDDLVFPRLVSTIGNPNAFGTFMVVLLMMAAGRLLSIRNRAGRLILWIYIGLSLILLLLSFSRSAYVGLLAAVMIFVWLYLQARGLSSASRVRQWWDSKPSSLRRLYTMLVVAVLVAVMGVGLIVIGQTFTDSARDPGLRTAIYGHAITAFRERPFTGHGLFTFGQELNRLQSQPPLLPHSHAHNAVLHIAAELGIPGLIALAATIYVFIRQGYENWRNPKNRKLLLAGISAVTGFAIAHQFDVPSMMPVLPMVGIVALIVMLAPAELTPVQAQWRRWMYLAGIPVLWGVLLLSGVVAATAYADYSRITREAVTKEDFFAGAQALDDVIRRDPYMPLYWNQQAYLYGVAASEGNDEAVQLGIDAYERYLELEPQDTIAMINLSALYWQAGEQQRAYNLASEAAEMEDKSWQYKFIAGNYAEAMGDLVLARYHYKDLTTNTYNLLYPQFDDTAFRRDFVAMFPKPLSFAAPLYAIHRDEIRTQADIDVIWERSRFDEDVHGERTYKTIVKLMLYIHSDLAEDYEEQFDDWLREAEKLIETIEDEAWLHVGQAKIAKYYGDEALAQQQYERVAEIIAPDFSRPDFSNGLNMPTFQFLGFAITRQFLPQVNYPSIDELPLLFLLDHS